MADVEDNNQKTGLVLIGIGPGDIGLVTSEALDAAKEADYRRYEAYTALWPNDQLASLEKLVGTITRVMRPEVENPEELFALARDVGVA